MGGAFFALLYYVAIWFQAVKGRSALSSAISSLPIVANKSQRYLEMRPAISDLFSHPCFDGVWLIFDMESSHTRSCMDLRTGALGNRTGFGMGTAFFDLAGMPVICIHTSIVPMRR